MKSCLKSVFCCILQLKKAPFFTAFVIFSEKKAIKRRKEKKIKGMMLDILSGFLHHLGFRKQKGLCKSWLIS